MKAIESLEQWGVFAEKLAANGYRIWQMQFDTRSPEGFHVWFWSSGKAEIEIVTHNDEVHDAITKYRSK